MTNVEPLFIPAEEQRFLDFSNLRSDRIPMAMVLLVGTFYILNMEYTPGI
jgi:hypothetical protein